MKFADKLTMLCNQKEWSQRRLVPVVGRSASTLSAWFKGTSLPDMSDALKLAQAFDVPLDWLADDEREFPPPTDLPDKDFREDEAAIVDLFHALRLTRTEALRALALEGQQGSELLPEIIRGLNKGGDEARDLAFDIIALGWRDFGYHHALKGVDLTGEDVDRWQRSMNRAEEGKRDRWRWRRPPMHERHPTESLRTNPVTGRSERMTQEEWEEEIREAREAEEKRARGVTSLRPSEEPQPITVHHEPIPDEDLRDEIHRARLHEKAENERMQREEGDWPEYAMGAMIHVGATLIVRIDSKPSKIGECDGGEFRNPLDPSNRIHRLYGGAEMFIPSEDDAAAALLRTNPKRRELAAPTIGPTIVVHSRAVIDWGRPGWASSRLTGPAIYQVVYNPPAQSDRKPKKK
ncbi:helix-turn-helix domain-containing protein [Singulisphaera rosea]